jgi:hypothetical protein
MRTTALVMALKGSTAISIFVLDSTFQLGTVVPILLNPRCCSDNVFKTSESNYTDH